MRAALHGAQDLRVALGEPRGRIALHAGTRAVSAFNTRNVHARESGARTLRRRWRPFLSV